MRIPRPVFNDDGIPVDIDLHILWCLMGSEDRSLPSRQFESIKLALTKSPFLSMVFHFLVTSSITIFEMVNIKYGDVIVNGAVRDLIILQGGKHLIILNSVKKCILRYTKNRPAAREYLFRERSPELGEYLERVIRDSFTQCGASYHSERLTHSGIREFINEGNSFELVIQVFFPNRSYRQRT